MMAPGTIRKRSLLIAGGTVLAAACVLGGLYERSLPRLPWHDSFASGSITQWEALGGAWAIYDGGIRNNSDDRGAKLVGGSADWSDYAVDADVLLLGDDGDAGLIVRSSDEEEGVDSYSGYYVGLRDRNNSLTIGRADHGWVEYQAVSPQHPLSSFQWYHLHVVAVGCEIAAVASDFVTGDRTWVAMHESPCARVGRIGLRSYSSGGVWKNVRVTKANAADLAPLLAHASPAPPPSFLQSEAGFNSLRLNQPGIESSLAESLHRPATAPLNAIGNLKAFSPLRSPRATVRGSVILTSPRVYLQDSTGGVAVDFLNTPPLKIGDEVEATGIVEPSRFSAVLHGASGRLLWQRSPSPPLSVTASQAATGVYDSMFVETEGELVSLSRNKDGSSVLLLNSGHQTFRAILDSPDNGGSLDRLAPDSVVRVRGVCVVNRAFTGDQTPFAVLLRSGDDLRLIAGPPWWDLRNLVMMAISLPILSLLGLFLYSRAEHWRLHAVLEERSRMAREIHDTLAQGFAAIALQLESALEQSGSRDPDTLSVALHMAERSRSEAHWSIAALRTLHEDAPLAELLRRILQHQALGGGVALLVTSRGSERRLPAGIEANLLRIAQECVANTVQHAHAHRVDIELTYTAEFLEMTIRDDGRGFDPASAPGADLGHFGITGVRERATQMRALIEIASRPGVTCISLRIPLPRPHPVAWRYLLAMMERGLNRMAALRRRLRRQPEQVHGQTYSHIDL
ncbi:MAG: ATP-binding protein [Acidobacteriaceae bacterium]